MKSLDRFIEDAASRAIMQEQTPTMSVGNNGYTSDATNSGPIAGFDKRLFPVDDDLLSQDFQTPAETGEDKYSRFASVYPVMKVTLGDNLGDGPSIDSMVAASKKFVDDMNDNTQRVIRKNFSRFIERASSFNG